jgi:hypothetical protein
MNLKRHCLIRYSLLYVFTFIISNSSVIIAQQSVGGIPVSFLPKNQSAFSKASKVKKVPALNMTRLKKEDKENSSNRFAAPVDVNYTLENSGEWVDLDDGGRVWKLEIKADNALGLFIFYKNFFLPNGARLFVYDENQKQLLGGYTYLNNSNSGKFMTGMIEGETAVIEYFEPWYAKGQGRFEINRIMQAYDREKIVSDYPFQNYTGFGESLPCHTNVNCEIGDDFDDQKRGVVRMLTVYNTGIGWCSGSMINNTNNDGKPYVLTANHCGYLGANIPDFSLWRFDFNYAFPTCANETEEPAFQSILGSEEISRAEDSDFLLLELSTNVPSSYNAYFNGWNRLNTPAENGTQIHHPFGDVMKISVDTNTLESYPFLTMWGGGVITPPHSHWRSVYDFGTIEGGSSGSPVFNQNGYIVGQLHGGVANCNQFIVYDGKFSVSWDDGADSTARLKEWLDPINTGFTQFGGIENPALSNSSTVLGSINKENGLPVQNVDINITGSETLTFNNQADGTFEAFDLINGNDYTLSPYRNDDHRNGVNVFDLVLIQKHILGLGNPLTPYQIIAADVDNSGTVNVFDLVHAQKVILQLEDEFPNNTAWRFVPTAFNFPDPTDPYSTPFPESIFYTPILTSIQDQNFVAIKVGDVNNSAN